MRALLPIAERRREAVTIRVVIADDERLIRAGYRMILDSEPDLEVVGEAADGVEAVEVARRLAPDVVLMDVRMPRLDGIAATRASDGRDPAPAVIVVTTFDLDEYVYEALRAGAAGFLLKDAPEQQLLAALRTAPEGVALFSPTVTRRLVEAFAAAERATDSGRAGATDDARDRGAHPGRPRPLQRRDLPRTGDRRDDGQDPRVAGAGQTPPRQPQPGRRAGLRDGPRPRRTGSTLSP